MKKVTRYSEAAVQLWGTLEEKVEEEKLTNVYIPISELHFTKILQW